MGQLAGSSTCDWKSRLRSRPSTSSPILGLIRGLWTGQASSAYADGERRISMTERLRVKGGDKARPTLTPISKP